MTHFPSCTYYFWIFPVIHPAAGSTSDPHWCSEHVWKMWRNGWQQNATGLMTTWEMHLLVRSPNFWVSRLSRSERACLTSRAISPRTRKEDLSSALRRQPVLSHYPRIFTRTQPRLSLQPSLCCSSAWTGCGLRGPRCDSTLQMMLHRNTSLMQGRPLCWRLSGQTHTSAVRALWSHPQQKNVLSFTKTETF